MFTWQLLARLAAQAICGAILKTRPKKKRKRRRKKSKRKRARTNKVTKKKASKK